MEGLYGKRHYCNCPFLYSLGLSSFLSPYILVAFFFRVMDSAVREGGEGGRDIQTEGERQR